MRNMAALLKEGMSPNGLEEALERRFEEYDMGWFASDAEYYSSLARK